MCKGANLMTSLQQKEESYWQQEGEKHVLQLFQKTATYVPAYKDFLSKYGVTAEGITTYEDFCTHVPVTDKDNYISQYEFADLKLRDGIQEGGMIHASSGTTGAPTFWQRSSVHDESTKELHHALLHTYFSIDTKNTLFIDCFAMGIHVAGFVTALAIYQLMKDHNHVHLATPGSKKEDIIHLILSLGASFDQLVFIGYPPLMKNTIEEIQATGFDFAHVDVGFLFAAQGFSESWRMHLTNIVGNGRPVPIINIYGSADTGAMAFETAETIAFRTQFEAHAEEDVRLLTRGDITPFVFQYIPTNTFFETYKNELLVSVDNAIPLVRYNMHDVGGIRTYESMKPYVQRDEAWQLPFVYVYGRSNYSVIFYGANIYPEHCLKSLEPSIFDGHITEKFFMQVQENDTHDPILKIQIQRARGMSHDATLEQHVTQSVIDELCNINREFLVVYKEMGNADKVHVSLHAYDDPMFVSKKMKYTHIQT